MKKLYRIYEFFFNRWKKIVLEEGKETWYFYSSKSGARVPDSEHDKRYIKYKYINKFDGSEKIVIEYI